MEETISDFYFDGNEIYVNISENPNEPMYLIRKNLMEKPTGFLCSPGRRGYISKPVPSELYRKAWEYAEGEIGKMIAKFPNDAYWIKRSFTWPSFEKFAFG